MSEVSISVSTKIHVESSIKLSKEFYDGLKSEVSDCVDAYLARFRRSYEKAWSQKKKKMVK